MTACSHCIDQSEHPSFVLLLEAVDESTGEQGTYWEHSRQPLHCLLAHQRRRRYKGAPKATKRFAAHWRMEIVVGPFFPAKRATQFRTVLQRVYGGDTATPKERRAGAITLARKWLEIEGTDEDALRVYAEEEADEEDTDAAQSLRLVREAVQVVHGSNVVA